ncbi:MAG: putative MFS family arabinose efflux permease, partial [Urechidicola sp.]
MNRPQTTQIRNTKTPSGIRQGLVLLQKRDFARLFTAYLISYAGNAMAPIAMAFGVLALTGSASDTALVIAAPTAAQIAILLLGGVLADRTSRQRLIVIADCLAFFSQTCLGLLLLTDSADISVLALVMLLNGAAMALHLPATTGLLPQIVAVHELPAANALLATARSGATMMGAAMAGILVAWVGAGVTLLIDAVSFGVSGYLVASLRPVPQAFLLAASIWRDLRLGWQAFIHHRWLWSIVAQFSLLVAAVQAVFGLLGPLVASTALGGPLDWGLISASFGLGTLLGGLLSLRLTFQRPLLAASLGILCMCLVPLALAPPLGVAFICLAAAVAGIGGQLFGVLWFTTLQQHIPAHLLSRVSAYDHLGSIALAPVGILLAGFSYESLGARATLLLAATTIIVPTLL